MNSTSVSFMLSAPKSELLSLGLTTFLYGLFFALFFVTVVMTFYAREPTRQHHLRILPASLLMLLVATTHVLILWVRAVQAFIVQKRGSALDFYNDLSDATSIARMTCLLVQSILGDFVMIWRLYVVYDKRFWVIIPAIVLVTGYTVVGSLAISCLQTARPDLFDVARSSTTAYFSLVMSSNIVSSGAIAARIFSAQKSQAKRNARPYRRIIVIIIESSALYALAVLAALVTFLCGTSGQYPAQDAIVPLVGIAFCLIAIQIRVHVSQTSSICIHPREHTPTGMIGLRSRETDDTTGDDKPTRVIPMSIHVTSRTTHV